MAYIDKEKLLQDITESVVFSGRSGTVAAEQRGAYKVISRIKAATTVDEVEVKHGRWKYYHKQNIAVCTNCSFERDLDANFGKAVCCPNCGAKMDGERRCEDE